MKQIRVHPCLFRVIRGECFWLRLRRAVTSAFSAVIFLAWFLTRLLISSRTILVTLALQQSDQRSAKEYYS
jgi:hypothetical protein